MSYRLRLTITTLALAAVLLIGSASVSQAATAGRGQAASLAAPSWLSALWTAALVQVAPVAIFNNNQHFGAKRATAEQPRKGGRRQADVICVINPNGNS